jgi:hypothetical protein
MSTTVSEYAEQQLAATGWAAINLNVAMRLRPALWGGIGTNALHDFGRAQHSAEALLAQLQGARLYQANVESIGRVKVLARHPQFLAERMAWILGLEVSDVQEIDARPRLPMAEPHKPKTDDKLIRLRITAAQELPAHQCSSRSDILAARAELESLGVAVEPAVAP